MADNKTFNETVQSLFGGMSNFMNTKTVVGEPVKVGDTLLVPLIDVSFGVAAGAWDKEKDGKNSSAGGMGGKMSPTAVLVIREGTVRVVDVQNSDPVSRIIDMVPDIIAKFTGKDKADPDIENAMDDIRERETKTEGAETSEDDTKQ